MQALIEEAKFLILADTEKWTFWDDLTLKTNFELFGSHDWVPLSFWVELGNVYTILFPLGDTCERNVDLSGT